MKRVFFLLVMLLLFSIASSAEPFKVIVDPGHGGGDSGAVVGETKESILTLEIAKKLNDLLKRDSNFESTLTRNQDHIVGLTDRCKIASQQKADLFISVHMNSSTDVRAHGTEVYFQSQMPADEETLFLANRENTETVTSQDDPTTTEKKGDLAVIVDDIKKTQNVYASEMFAEILVKTWKSEKLKNHQALRFRGQPIRQGPFKVLVSVPMPSVLIEVGYLTHPEDLEKLKNPQYQTQVAMAIYKGIKKFKEQIDKSEFSSHIVTHATRLKKI